MNIRAQSMMGARSFEHPQVAQYNVDNITAEQLPRASANPYRKRPVKLVYDKNDFHMFKLPSEKAFLLGSFDHEDVFGKRKNTNHSPHIRAQMDLDTRLIYAMAVVMTLGVVFENKRTHNYTTLRENLYNSDMGWFKAEDFK